MAELLLTVQAVSVSVRLMELYTPPPLPLVVLPEMVQLVRFAGPLFARPPPLAEGELLLAWLPLTVQLFRVAVLLVNKPPPWLAELLLTEQKFRYSLPFPAYRPPPCDLAELLVTEQKFRYSLPFPAYRPPP